MLLSAGHITPPSTSSTLLGQRGKDPCPCPPRVTDVRTEARGGKDSSGTVWAAVDCGGGGGQRGRRWTTVDCMDGGGLGYRSRSPGGNLVFLLFLLVRASGARAPPANTHVGALTRVDPPLAELLEAREPGPGALQ